MALPITKVIMARSHSPLRGTQIEAVFVFHGLPHQLAEIINDLNKKSRQRIYYTKRLPQIACVADIPKRKRK